MKVTKAVIPAAGLGTRMLTMSKSVPKEMLPLVDKPAIQYLVEEAVAAGIADILIITGRGGGLTDAAFLKKKEVISHALALHKPDSNDPIDVLSKVGGFDLCAMTGVFLGAARQRLPVVVDGFISIVAALCAGRLAPLSKGYFLGSHRSFEVGFRLAERELGLKPCLELSMRLGEGSGCPIAFRVVEAAGAVMNTMATFPEAAIDDTYLTEIRAKDSFTV